jgi:hypothetical protein
VAEETVGAGQDGNSSSGRIHEDAKPGTWWTTTARSRSIPKEIVGHYFKTHLVPYEIRPRRTRCRFCEIQDQDYDDARLGICCWLWIDRFGV